MDSHWGTIEIITDPIYDTDGITILRYTHNIKFVNVNFSEVPTHSVLQNIFLETTRPICKKYFIKVKDYSILSSPFFIPRSEILKK